MLYVHYKGTEGSSSERECENTEAFKDLTRGLNREASSEVNNGLLVGPDPEPRINFMHD